MQITRDSALRGFYHSCIGRYLRNKVIEKVCQEKTENISSNNIPSLPRITNILEADRFSPLRSLEKVANESPEQTVFINKGYKYKAKEVFSNVKRFANGLKQLGIKPGDGVAIMAMPNEKELFESFFAIQSIGAMPIVINFLNPPSIIAYMIAKSNAKTLIVGRDYRFRAGANKLFLTGLLENVITIGKTDYEDKAPPKNISGYFRGILNESAYNPLFYTYEALVKQDELDQEELLLNPDKNDPALILFTSGTENKPKKITYTNEVVANVLESTSPRFQITENDTFLLPVPFYHLAGLIVLLAALNFKSKMVLTDIPRTSKPETIQKAIQNIVANNVTILPGVPRIIEPILEEAVKQDLVLDSLKTVFSGASPMTPKLINLVETINKKRIEKGISPINIVNFYASTECGPISSSMSLNDSIDSLGYPFNNVEAKLGDNDELLIKIPSFPPDLPQKTLNDDGYFKTGDQVTIESDGKLIYRDRLGDRLNINGEKISPLTVQRELEIALKAYGIKEVFVFGVRKPTEKTDVCTSVMIPETGKNIKVNEIRSILKKHFPSELKAFTPSVIIIEKNGIPVSLIGGTGKVSRKSLVKYYSDQVLKEYYENKNLQGLVKIN